MWMACETLINKYEVLHERELGIKYVEEIQQDATVC